MDPFAHGYAVYEKYGKKKEVTHLACWAHVRNEFEKALDNDKQRAEKALFMIQKLYAIESRVKEGELDAKQIKEIRLTESLPVINELGKWIFEEIKNTLPKSQIGQATFCASAVRDFAVSYQRLLGHGSV
ncbi:MULTISPECIES: IS66 family transposase [Sphingobacterium]|uniref:IS66 family transposase n=1 Tax=Sphingobacterium TaxID=28453 RepID=UPI001F094FA6|nr:MULTISPECIES: IS66 family transposase [unclassified Sphingobacterium]